MFHLIFDQSVLCCLGLAAAALGISFFFGDPATLPAKADLKQVAGNLDSATKITTKRRRGGTSVNYELEIKPASGESVKFKLPEREITEAQVKNLLGSPLTVLHSDSNDVWELSTGPSKVIEYEATKVKRKHDIEENAAMAPYVTGGGLLVLALGVLWWRRRGSI